MPEEKMTYTEAWQEAKEELKSIRKEQTATNVRLASIDEHLKSLNGSVARNERRLDGLDVDVVELRVGAKGTQAKLEEASGLAEFLRDNGWNVLQTIVLAVILTAIASNS